MNTPLAVFLAVLCLQAALAAQGAPHDLSQLPLTFERNEGQMHPSVQFAANAGGYRLLLTNQGLVLRLHESAIRIGMNGDGGSLHAEGLEPSGTLSNYFPDNNPAHWRTGVRHFQRVRYANVYPGIDALFYGQRNQLEFDWIVSPGSDPGKIRLVYEGATRLTLQETGDLTVTSGKEEIQMLKPAVYQETAAGRRAIEARYVLVNEKEVRLELGRYDATAPLSIDPLLRY